MPFMQPVLVWRRPLNIVDHENFDGASGRFQPKPELLADGGE
jgi:hypothetical protein